MQKKKSSTEELNVLKKDLEKEKQLRMVIEKELNEVKKQN